MLRGVRERERSWLSLESCLSDCDPYVNITKFPGSSFCGSSFRIFPIWSLQEQRSSSCTCSRAALINRAGKNLSRSARTRMLSEEQVRSIVAGRQGRYSLWSLMFGGGFFFLDQFVNKPWHAATAETPRWLVFCFPLWVTHEAFVERFFRSYEVIVIKSQLAALAAL
jgi:hypothetical protein